MDDLKAEVSLLSDQVRAGGDVARKALTRLVDLSNLPNAKWIMSDAGIVADCAKLMSKVETGEQIQRLAGSVIARVTDLPVTSSSSDEKTGSYGRTHIVIPRPSRVYRPDETMIALMAGVQPSATSARDYLSSPVVDQ